LPNDVRVILENSIIYSNIIESKVSISAGGVGVVFTNCFTNFSSTFIAWGSLIPNVIMSFYVNVLQIRYPT